MKSLSLLLHRGLLSRAALAACLVTLSLVLPAAPAQGQTVIATVPVGQWPTAMSVNPVTNKVYVSNIGSRNVTVINGATNQVITTVTAPYGFIPLALASNYETNEIYVANDDISNGGGGVIVIDGLTYATTTVSPSERPTDVAVNLVTDKIYVPNNSQPNGVTVIDGATNSATTVTDPNAYEPRSVVVNQVTNKIYVSNMGGNYINGNVTVIDGATNSTTTVTDPNVDMGGALAVNDATNKIYVCNSHSGVTVIDGATNSTTIVTDPNASGPFAIAVNPVTNKVYVVNIWSNNITVIDGATNLTTTVADPNAKGASAIAVNSVTNKVYVANSQSSNITMIDGATNFTTTVADPNGRGPRFIAVNPLTNRIYVNNYGSNNVTVIAGAEGGPVSLYPASLQFGSQLLHTPSQPQTVTLTNTGSTTLNISSIVASTNFYRTNHCPSALAPGASCTIKVTFRPLSICSQTGTLTITDDASNSPQTVTLSGVGTVMTLSATNLNFGIQAAGTTSSPQSVTFTNHATSRVVPISNVLIKGGNFLSFAQTNTCGTSVAPGASCTFSVTFTPHDKWPKTSTLYIWNGGGNTPETVALTGHGS